MMGAVLPSAAFASTHAVTFAQNDSPNDQTTSIQNASTITSLTPFSQLIPAFSNPGYVFKDWNEAANGSGTFFADSSQYDFTLNTSDIVLYAQWTEDSVTYFENSNGSDLVNAVQLGHTATSLLPYSALSPSFSNPGYSFAGWTTNANGSGTSYANGANYDFTKGSLILFAQWIPIAGESVSFNANGASGSLTAIGGLQGSTVALPGPGSLSNTNYTFGGWNTSSGGGGTGYSQGELLTLNSSLVLYAQWLPNVFTVSYNAEGGTSSVSVASFTFGSASLVLPSAAFAGHVMVGWFTSATGGTLVGVGGASYVPISSTELFVQWSPGVIIVTYNANGGIVSPTSATFSNGMNPLILPIPTLAGSNFNGWFTALSGGVLAGAGAAQFTPSTSLVLYAQWQSSSSVTVSFDANGAGGAVPSMSGSPGSAITVPGVIGLVNPGFTLVKWNSLANGTGTSFASGAAMTLRANVTLYAQWAGHRPAVIIGAVGQFNGTTTIVTANLKREAQKFAALIKLKRYTVVTLYGYSIRTGLASRNVAISRQRASAVATYLRSQLKARHVSGVTVKSTGEGSVAGASVAVNSRVEVMVY
jgi:hypothetical protein